MGLAQGVTPWEEPQQPHSEAGTQLGRRWRQWRAQLTHRAPLCQGSVLCAAAAELKQEVWGSPEPHLQCMVLGSSRSLWATKPLCSHTDLGSNANSCSSPLCDLEQATPCLCASCNQALNIYRAPSPRSPFHRARLGGALVLLCKTSITITHLHYMR